MIRIVVVDDHPAVRTGLAGLLRREPGFVVVGAVATATEGLEEVRRWSPDLALVDYDLEDQNGLRLARRVARHPYPPRVVLYTAFGTEQLSLTAAAAGVRAVVDKDEPVDALLQVLRDVARGDRRLGRLSPEFLRSGAEALEPEDHALLGLVLAGEPPAEIADVLDCDEHEVESRLDGIVERLRPRTSRDVERSRPSERRAGRGG